MRRLGADAVGMAGGQPVHGAKPVGQRLVAEQKKEEVIGPLRGVHAQRIAQRPGENRERRVRLGLDASHEISSGGIG